MASVDSYQVEGEEGEKRFYNVDMAVGPNAPNRRDDVLLVQYMLKRVYERPVYKKLTLSPQQGTMSVDGISGPITARWIRHFQSDVRTAGGSVVVDGRIDRALPGGAASISGTEYTIFWLNDAFRGHYPEIFNNMPVHPDVPADLKAALLRSIVVA
jgi:hypothetical protein